MAQLLDGKKLRDKILAELKLKIDKFEKKPTLVVILVGENSASKIYVNNKKKTAEKLGINSKVLQYPQNITEAELLNKIEELAPFGTGLKMPLLAIENKNYKRFIVSNKYPKFSIDNKLSAISFNENLKYRDGKYFIGNLKEDTYRKNCLSFLIEDII